MFALAEAAAIVDHRSATIETDIRPLLRFGTPARQNTAIRTCQHFESYLWRTHQMNMRTFMAKPAHVKMDLARAFRSLAPGDQLTEFGPLAKEAFGLELPRERAASNAAETTGAYDIPSEDVLFVQKHASVILKHALFNLSRAIRQQSHPCGRSLQEFALSASASAEAARLLPGSPRLGQLCRFLQDFHATHVARPGDEDYVSDA